MDGGKAKQMSLFSPQSDKYCYLITIIKSLGSHLTGLRNGNQGDDKLNTGCQSNQNTKAVPVK